MSMRWCGIARAGREVRLGGADIHAAIHLRGIDAHDLERQCVGEIERERPICPRPSAPSARARSAARRVRLRRRASAPAHEQSVEIPERQPHPGRTAVIALVGARSVRSISRSSAFISGRLRLRCARTAAWQAMVPSRWLIDSSTRRECPVSSEIREHVAHDARRVTRPRADSESRAAPAGPARDA